MSPSGAKKGAEQGASNLVWDGATPASARFGDVYYSRGLGLAEKRHVFLAGCGLPDAWRGRAAFTICGLGFGTGLTFLATCRLWAETAAPGARLRYLAVEGYPLTPSELRASLAPWREVAREAEALRGVYPEPQPGVHRLHPLPDIDLTLLCGDAAAMLGAAEAEIDAWFLDGFAPSKNPEMWSPVVFGEVARLSAAGARLSTYTAAGPVRRGLQEAGFTVELTAGFGRKRDMIQGRYTGQPQRRRAPWFAPAAPRRPERAAIVGGGIAGTAAAAALARRGWTCTIVEQGDALAAAASGTPSAVAMPRLTAGLAIDGRIHAGAWRYAVQSWRGAAFYRPCGVLQLATDAAEAERQTAIAAADILPGSALHLVDWPAATGIAGYALPCGALHFTDGGWLDAKALCAARAAGAEVMTRHPVNAIARDGDGWRLAGPRGVLTADVVILANSGGACALSQTAWLPLTARRGQITAAASSAASASLRCVLSYGGSITPAREGKHHIGATFDDARTNELRDSDDARNLAALADVLPDLARGLVPGPGDSWAGVRWTSPDHLPAVGPVADTTAFGRDYAPLRHGQHWVEYPPAAYAPGLYVMAGFGSHGLVLAPLCAELLASQICGEPAPVESDLGEALHPSRFLLRELKRARLK